MEVLTTGQVARRADVHIETLRYYERRGLLPKPPRTGSNRREYPKDAVSLVRFVKRAQSLGFTLVEIQELLDLRSDPKAGCSDVADRAKAKLREVDSKIRALRVMRKTLKRLIDECPAEGSTTECSILSALEAEGGEW